MELVCAGARKHRELDARIAALRAESGSFVTQVLCADTLPEISRLALQMQSQLTVITLSSEMERGQELSERQDYEGPSKSVDTGESSLETCSLEEAAAALRQQFAGCGLVDVSALHATAAAQHVKTSGEAMLTTEQSATDEQHSESAGTRPVPVGEGLLRLHQLHRLLLKKGVRLVETSVQVQSCVGSFDMGAGMVGRGWTPGPAVAHTHTFSVGSAGGDEISCAVRHAADGCVAVTTVPSSPPHSSRHVALVR